MAMAFSEECILHMYVLMCCSTMLSFCWLDFERIVTATKQYRDPQAGQLTKSILYFFVRVTWLCMQNSEVFKCPGLENLSRYEKLFKLLNVRNNHTCGINCWCRSLLGDWALLLNTAGQLKAIIPFTRWSIARICTHAVERDDECASTTTWKFSECCCSIFSARYVAQGASLTTELERKVFQHFPTKLFSCMCVWVCICWPTCMRGKYIFYLKCFSAKTLSSTVHTLREMPWIKSRSKDPFSL